MPHHAAPPLSAAYIPSIDSLRVLAMLAVVGIHCFAFWTDPLIYSPVQLLARFAVPYFFLISGFLFTRKTVAGYAPFRVLAGTTPRLAGWFVFWSLFYALAPAVVPKNFPEILEHGLGFELLEQIRATLADLGNRPVFYLLQGPGLQLWFLPALICAQFILALAIQLQSLRLMLILGLILYAVALLNKPYVATPWGLHWAFDTRNGPFSATLFVAMGAWLALMRQWPGVWTAIAVLVGGYVIQYLEAAALRASNPALPLAGHDFLLGTVPMSTGFLLLALALPELGARFRIHRLAPLVLGIYLIHVAVRDYLEPWVIHLPYYGISWTLTTFFISAVLVSGVRRVPVLRRCVA